MRPSLIAVHAIASPCTIALCVEPPLRALRIPDKGQRQLRFSPRCGSAGSIHGPQPGRRHALLLRRHRIRCEWSRKRIFERSERPRHGTPPPIGPANYGGYLDGADCNYFSGWAYNANNVAEALTIDFFSDSSYLGSVTANTLRPDVKAAGYGTGLYGFAFPSPSALADGGAHSIVARFSGTQSSLYGSPVAIICPGSGTPPINPPNYGGHLDRVDCSDFSGWAYDANNLNRAVSVDFYSDGFYVGSSLANTLRSDVRAAGYVPAFTALAF